MRKILSPLDGLVSPFGAIVAAGGEPPVTGFQPIYGVNNIDPLVVGDFVENVYSTDGQTDSDFSTIFTLSRPSPGRYRDANGNWVEVQNNLPRVGHHVWDDTTSSWVNKGLLIENVKKDNFLLDSENPATQTITLPFTGTFTLWVEGSGSAEITAGGSGTATEGNYLTFTASSTTVTVTVTGTLDRYQLEQGTLPTSYILTTTQVLSRQNETIYMNPSQTTYNQTGMSLHTQGEINWQDNDVVPEFIFWRWIIDGQNVLDAYVDSSFFDPPAVFFRQEYLDNRADAFATFNPGFQVPYSVGATYSQSIFRAALNGSLAGTDTPGGIPDLSGTDLRFSGGFTNFDGAGIGTISLIRMWDQDVGETGIVEAVS